MDARQKAQLEALKLEQRDLRLRLDTMDRRIGDLESALLDNMAESKPTDMAMDVLQATPVVQEPQAVQPTPILPPPLPVIKPMGVAPTGKCDACGSSSTFPGFNPGDTALCPSCGCSMMLHIQMPQTEAMKPARPVESVQAVVALPVPTVLSEVKPALQPVTVRIESPEPEPEERSLEMWLGTHWFVRVGAISILTGLVFLANYAYHNWIFARSPIVKVTLLYCLSFGLAGGGWFLQRWQEQLRRYGQVLMATGLAATYFTTYAAHYFQNLRVIESASVAGVMLLGIAGFMVWIADRKRSEALAMFAIGLAYYTSVINEIRTFTLLSNLALTVSAVCFLIRNRWATLSFASLVATYGSFFYWRFYQDQRWLWRFPMSTEDFWLGAIFLASYWIAFTAPVFLSRHPQFADGRRASFLTLNNGAFFGFTAWTLHLAYPSHFWQWSLCFGVILIALGALAEMMMKEDAVTRDAYTSKGLILVTIGFLAKFHGAQLSLILAGQSVVMLIMGYLRNNRIVRGGAFLVAGLAALLALDDFKPFDGPALLMGISVAAFLVFNGWWVERNTEREGDRPDICPEVAWFVGLGLLVGFLAAWHNTAEEFRAPLLALLAVGFTGTWYVLRLRELVLFGQGYLVVAQFLWLAQITGKGATWPWWNPMTVIAVTLGLGHWWQHQSGMSTTKEVRHLLQGAYALAVVAVLHVWLRPLFSQEQWMWMTCLVAMGFTGYGVVTRAWFVAGCGQLFLVFSGWQFIQLILGGHPSWFLSLTPIATLAGLAFVAIGVLRDSEEVASEIATPVLQLSLVYRIAAALMSVMWIVEYVSERERFWVFALVGLVLFAWAGWVKRVDVFGFSAFFTVVGFGHYWFHSSRPEMVYLPNILAVLALAIQQHFARKSMGKDREMEPLHTVAIMMVAGTLWLFFTQWVHRAGSGFYHTAVWAVLALMLFGVGLPLRERVYRCCGMAILTLALARVAFIDIWKLDAIYKIISCIGLGVVLLVLGFIYNKYQDQIRRWL